MGRGWRQQSSFPGAGRVRQGKQTVTARPCGPDADRMRIGAMDHPAVAGPSGYAATRIGPAVAGSGLPVLSISRPRCAPPANRPNAPWDLVCGGNTRPAGRGRRRGQRAGQLRGGSKGSRQVREFVRDCAIRKGILHPGLYSMLLTNVVLSDGSQPSAIVLGDPDRTTKKAQPNGV
jgi:hypothetical protein